MAHILIVDDREEDRYLLQGLLQGAGHWITAAANGAEALEIAHRSPPELVASDIFMPRMDGFTLCREWRKDSRLRDIPFVFYSATYTGPEDERFALSLGADRFILKPREPEELLIEIESVLAEQRAGTLAGRRQAPPADPDFEAAHGETIARKLESKITELERSNRRLGEAEAKFRALVEQALAGIYIIDELDRLYYCNPRLTMIFGYGAEEMPGLNFYQLVDPESRAWVEAQLKRRRNGEVSSADFEFVGRRKNGDRINIGAHGSVTRLNNRPVVIGMLQDITEQKQAEARTRENIAMLERAMMGTINAVAVTAELRDPYTAGHERRVGDLAAAIGTELGMDENTVRGLRVIGLVHDVGKISVPAEILNKPGRLSPIEFEMIKTHAERGFQILKDAQFPWPVAEAILQHHERLDGSGYPQGLKGDAIIQEARIMAVADVVEAMASHRPYRPGLGLEAALAEVEKNMGRRYDERAVRACLTLFRDKGYELPK